MEEIKTTKSFEDLTAIYAAKVVNEYEIEAKCMFHGPYKVTVTEYDDGNSSFLGECPECKKEAEERKRLSELREQEEENIRIEANYKKWCVKHNIEPEFYHKTLDDYIPATKGQEKAKEAAAKIIAEKKGNLVVLGQNGSGKSLLLNILALSLGGKVYSMYEIATMIRQSYTIKAERSELEIVNDLASCPFLGIDEVGRIAVSEAVLNWFSYILDKRSVRNLPYAIAGNVHFKKDCPDKGCPKCFENQFDTDILSRLRRNSTFIYIKADDKRKTEGTSVFWEDK